MRPHTYYTERSYRADSRMVAFLGVIVVLMIAVTALGVVGLASFQVNVRRKQIGTRRAVGARRIDILRYFMVENWLLTTGGVIIGSLLAFGFGQWLSVEYSLPRLEPMYVAGGRRVALVARTDRGIRASPSRRGDPAGDCDEDGLGKDTECTGRDSHAARTVALRRSATNDRIDSRHLSSRRRCDGDP